MAKFEQYKEQLTQLQARLYQIDATIEQLQEQKAATKIQADRISAAIQGIEEDRKEAAEAEEVARKQVAEEEARTVKKEVETKPSLVETINEETLAADNAIEEKKTTS